MKKLIIPLLFALLFVLVMLLCSCDLFNSGIPEFIDEYGNRVVTVPLPTVATPVISIPEGQDASKFDFSQPITFTSTTEDVTFYYTTDGSDPTTESPLFSSVNPFTFTLPANATPPLARSSTNAATTNLQDLGLTSDGSDPITSSPSGDTLISSTPTTKSSTNAASSNLQDLEIKVIAVKPGYTNSVVATETFIYKPPGTVAPPVFDPAEGDFVGSQEVTLIPTPPDATIYYYTTDGTTIPDATSTRYVGSFNITATTTVNAIAVKEGINSDVAKATFTKKVATPVISPTEESVDFSQPITFTSTTEGVTFHYTIDDIIKGITVPTEPSISEASINLQELGLTDTCTVKVIAKKTDYTDSDEAEETFTPLGKVPPPDIVPPDGSDFFESQNVIGVELTCEGGATIYYTTDGTLPNPKTSTKYNGSFTLSTVNNSYIVKAIAVKDGSVDSGVAKAIFTKKLELPSIDIAKQNADEFDFSKSITFESTTKEGVTFHYTTNGADPTKDSPIKIPFTLLTDKDSYTVKVIAVKPGCNNSDVATFIFKKARVKTPNILYDGENTAFDFSKSITFESTTKEGVTFHYTTNETDPTKDSPSKIPFTLPTNKDSYTVRVIAVKEGYTNSAEAVKKTFTKAKVATPSIRPTGKSLFANNAEPITLASDTPNANIYYTIDGTDPATSRNRHLYNDNTRFNVTVTDKTVEIRAIAEKLGFGTSTEASTEFTQFMKTALVEKGDFKRTEKENTHIVTLIKDYDMGITEVTQEQYLAVTGKKPSFCKPTLTNWEEHPVEQVSWYDAIEFCNALSILEGVKPYYNINRNDKDSNNNNSDAVDPYKWKVTPLNNNGYRLPTEAEWEHAAREGKNKDFIYSGSNELEKVAHATKGEDIHIGTMPVGGGGREPNGLGLYDMSGNVREWCWDWNGSYPPNGTENPKGPPSGKNRVMRGGSYLFTSDHCKVASRGQQDLPNVGWYNSGFRVVRSKE